MGRIAEKMKCRECFPGFFALEGVHGHILQRNALLMLWQGRPPVKSANKEHTALTPGRVSALTALQGSLRTSKHNNAALSAYKVHSLQIGMHI